MCGHLRARLTRYIRSSSSPFLPAASSGSGGLSRRGVSALRFQASGRISNAKARSSPAFTSPLKKVPVANNYPRQSWRRFKIGRNSERVPAHRARRSLFFARESALRRYHAPLRKNHYNRSLPRPLRGEPQFSNSRQFGQSAEIVSHLAISRYLEETETLKANIRTPCFVSQLSFAIKRCSTRGLSFPLAHSFAHSLRHFLK